MLEECWSSTWEKKQSEKIRINWEAGWIHFEEE